jgi:hypothetical protein
VPRFRWKRIAVLLLCAGLSLCWSYNIRRPAHDGIGMIDFAEIYYGAQCALHHHDPYDANTVLQDFRAEGGKFPVDYPAATISPIVVTIDVNLPTTLLLVAPIATLSWGPAKAFWILLTVGLLVLAGCSMWSLGGEVAPALSGCLVGITLANCEQLLTVGNVAGIAVSLCVIATWCFLKERYIVSAICLFAISLALKPHDSGFIWLYFLLAGGVMRKRALQTLAVAGILGLMAVAWIAPSSPHWLQELHRNHIIVSQTGGTSDPSLSGVTSGRVGSIIDLQAALSAFLKDPHSYNLGSYLIVGSLIVAWAFVVLRRRRRLTPVRARLAIAAIAVLSLLPVYHRPYDAKLLMLTIPACAILWAEGGAMRWLSFAFTLAGILLTSDIPMGVLVSCAKALSISTSMPAGTAGIVSLAPPLVLLAMGCFYLWAYTRSSLNLPMHIQDNGANEPIKVSGNTLIDSSEPECERTELMVCGVSNGAEG